MKQSDKTLSSSSKLIKEMKKEFVLLKMNKNRETREKLLRLAASQTTPKLSSFRNKLVLHL